MATTITLLQHDRHDQHPLELRDFSRQSIPPHCDLCYRTISADGYACLECHFYAHIVCAEAPPRIDHHPLHVHPLTLIHRLPPLINNVCDMCDSGRESLFRCDECDFNLDVGCALSFLSVLGKIIEKIRRPFHPHALTLFSTQHDCIRDVNCVICKASVEGDGYACWPCEFIIHRRCIQDLYYTDGTKAPQVYHRHLLETFLGGHMGSIKCVKCGSDESSREFIGCAECQVFYCRDCVQVPDIIQYPHRPGHNLVLLINSTDNDRPDCDSCLHSLEGMLCYGCPSCEFFMDVGCALQFYSEEGISTEIELSWHKHPLHLCHRLAYEWNCCSYCEDIASGPMYTCKEEGCEFLLHKRCTEIESTKIHPHHPDHQLTLCSKQNFGICQACSEYIKHLEYSCKLCAFHIHAKCAAHVPARKHSFHEHELLHLEKCPYWKCNRCGNKLSSSFFRCVPCNFNLHEECMELPPQVVNSEVHWHPLTLHETYVEDDSGEYYCDRCEKRRDGRMGVYVCLQCSARWAYHMECIFPELRKVCVKEHNSAEVERLAYDITRREEEIREVERKLEEMKGELDEQRKKHAALTVQ